MKTLIQEQRNYSMSESWNKLHVISKVISKIFDIKFILNSFIFLLSELMVDTVKVPTVNP